jgi:hypothetical protein
LYNNNVLKARGTLGTRDTLDTLRLMPDVFTPQAKKQAESKHPAKPTVDKKNVVENEHHNPLGLLTTFCQKPSNVSLMGQDNDEHIILFLRQDFITNLPWVFNTILFSFLPFIVYPLFAVANIDLNFLPARFNLVIAIFYYLLLAGYALSNYLTWFYTIGIITNKKAVDIDFHNLSSIHVGTVNLADTSDAKYKQAGFFQSFFDYGDIIITVEATKEQFIFEKTPRPAEITDMLSDLIGER